MWKTIGRLSNLNNISPKVALVPIFKTFVQPNLDYDDVPYNQAFNSAFQSKLESIQYNTRLVTTRAIKGTSRKTIY